MIKQHLGRLFDGRTRSGRRGRKLTALGVIFATLTAVSIYAWADSPDPVLPLSGSEVINPDQSITLTVHGGWAWPTHNGDCTTQKTVGWAVDWNDQSQPGGLVGTVNGVTVDVGAAAANTYNPKDLATHYYPGPNPPKCGTFNPALGYNTGNWGPGPGVLGRPGYPNGETHTYPPGTTTVSPCVVMYDMHNVGSSDLIAGGQGHDGDNSVQSNQNTPLGNGCFTFNFPKLTSNASVDTTTGLVSDTAHLTGGNSPTGTITFKAYGPNDAGCNNPPVFTGTADVNLGNHDYAPTLPASGFVPSGLGTYRWTLDYNGDKNNAAASSGCNAANESITINPQARIQIDPPSAANQTVDPSTHLNNDHVLTVTVKKEHSGAASFVPADGVLVTATTDFGSFKNGTNTCTTDGNGQCQVTLQSNSTGLSTINASATVAIEGQNLSVKTDGKLGNSGPALKHWVDALLTISPPSAANQIGDTHTFVAHLLIDKGDGNGMQNAANEVIHFTKTAGPGTLQNTTCTTLADGTCSVHLTSGQTGLSTVSASWSNGIQVGNDTAAAKAFSGDALKHWVDAQLRITPETAANQIGVTHHFTATLKFDKGDGNGFQPAPSGSKIDFTIDSGPGALSPSSCTTGPGGPGLPPLGVCGVDLTSNTTGLTTVHANWTGSIAVANDTASAKTQSNNAVKQWTNAHLVIDPASAANQVNVDHIFHAHLTFDYGDGKGFVKAPAGQSIGFTKDSGPGAFSGNPCTTDVNGECDVHLTSSVTGVTTVHASWTGGINTGANGTAQASTTSNGAVKHWVDPILTIDPLDAANQVNNTHTFHVHLSFRLDPATVVPAPDGSTVNLAIDSGPGAFTPGGAATSCNTVAGTCSVDLNSAVTGLTTVHAKWTGGIQTVEGIAQATTPSVPATKLWTNAKLDLTPTPAVNHVGDTHHYTATLQFDKGTGTYVNAGDGEVINFTIQSGPGTLSANSCSTVAGVCHVDLTSTVTGSTDVQGTWSGKIGTAHGDAIATATATAVKHWVDALILINPPAAENEVGHNHTFTVTVFKTVDGVTSPAAGIVAHTSAVNSLGATASYVGSPDCTTNASGQCNVVIVSSTTGVTTVTASATVPVTAGGITKNVDVITDGQNGNQAPAQKRWVKATLDVTPPEATNKVGDPHVFTAHLKLDFGNGAGLVDGANQPITWQINSGPGSLSGTNCTTDASGSCQVTLTSAVAGTTTVEGDWSGTLTTTLAGTQVSASLTQSDTAIKHWVTPAITLDKKVDGADHNPIADALNAHQGDTLNYTVKITNTGDIALTITNLADTLHANLAASCGTFNIGDSLAVGASINCAYTGIAPANDITNVASVVATYLSAGPNPASGTLNASDQTFVHILHPAISLVKTGEALAHEGDKVTYGFDVKNTGDVDLSNVAVTDNVLGAIGTVGNLAVGASAHLTKDFTVPTGVTSVTNTATACGVDSGNVQVCASDHHTLIVIHPTINIVKTANPTTADPGQTVTYTYVVTNTGDTILHDVVVTDNVIGAIGTIATLNPNQSVTLTKSFTVAANSPRTNIGQACGTDALNLTVCDTDPATITIVLPIPPQHRLPKTGFEVLFWAAFGMVLTAAGLAMMKTRREFLGM